MAAPRGSDGRYGDGIGATGSPTPRWSGFGFADRGLREAHTLAAAEADRPGRLAARESRPHEPHRRPGPPSSRARVEPAVDAGPKLEPDEKIQLLDSFPESSDGDGDDQSSIRDAPALRPVADRWHRADRTGHPDPEKSRDIRGLMRNRSPRRILGTGSGGTLGCRRAGMTAPRGPSAGWIGRGSGKITAGSTLCSGIAAPRTRPRRYRIPPATARNRSPTNPVGRTGSPDPAGGSAWVPQGRDGAGRAAPRGRHGREGRYGSRTISSEDCIQPRAAPERSRFSHRASDCAGIAERSIENYMTQRVRDLGPERQPHERGPGPAGGSKPRVGSTVGAEARPHGRDRPGRRAAGPERRPHESRRRGRPSGGRARASARERGPRRRLRTLPLTRQGRSGPGDAVFERYVPKAVSPACAATERSRLAHREAIAQGSPSDRSTIV